MHFLGSHSQTVPESCKLFQDNAQTLLYLHLTNIIIWVGGSCPDHCLPSSLKNMILPYMLLQNMI